LGNLPIIRIFLIALSVAALTCAACRSPKPAGQALLLGHEAEIDRILAELTLEEKVQMLHSMSPECRKARTFSGPFAFRQGTR